MVSEFTFKYPGGGEGRRGWCVGVHGNKLGHELITAETGDGHEAARNYYLLMHMKFSVIKI